MHGQQNIKILLENFLRSDKRTAHYSSWSCV